MRPRLRQRNERSVRRRSGWLGNVARRRGSVERSGASHPERSWRQRFTPAESSINRAVTAVYVTSNARGEGWERSDMAPRRRVRMLSTILVPLDGSPLAERALPFAERLARGTKARLVLTRVVPISRLPNVEETVATAAQEYLERIASRLAGAGLVSQTALLHG